VTRRAGIGDWEGKASVPDALPRWFELFTVNDKGQDGKDAIKEPSLFITGATSMDDCLLILNYPASLSGKMGLQRLNLSARVLPLPKMFLIIYI